MLLWEGTIKGENDRVSGLLLLSCLGVSTQVFGSFNKPQTLYFSCLGASRSRKHNQNAQCYLFVNEHASRPIWRTLSYCDFIYLMATQVDHYLLPLNLVSSEAWITTLQ